MEIKISAEDLKKIALMARLFTGETPKVEDIEEALKLIDEQRKTQEKS